jgi:ATP-dependent Clp protease adaptor protein ClpS
MAKEAVKTRTSTELRYPGRYNVVIYNDDYTPVEFVIKMLVEVFNKDVNTAKSLTQEIHSQGASIAGTYNAEIAEQKCSEGISISRANGHPLQLKVEKVE